MHIGEVDRVDCSGGILEELGTAYYPEKGGAGIVSEGDEEVDGTETQRMQGGRRGIDQAQSRE